MIARFPCLCKYFRAKRIGAVHIILRAQKKTAAQKLCSGLCAYNKQIASKQA